MLKRAAELLEDATRTRSVPGAVLRVECEGAVVHESGHGVTRFDQPAPVTPDTWFDLASLTKILATTPVIMRLVQRGMFSLDTPLREFLPTMTGALGDQPAWRFLHHTSGARAWDAYFERVPADRRGTRAGKHLIAQQLLAEATTYPPGTRQIYSDVGFALLALALESATGKSLPALFRDEVAAPVGVSDLAFLQVEPRADITIAATADCPWRGRVVSGEVHDDNTFSAGGALGQAGLFGTAAAVARVMDEFRRAALGQSNVFAVEIFARFMDRPDNLPGASYRLGFDGVSVGASTTGIHFGPRTFGHLGFTGVSAWCDPDSQCTVVLLTNRVHPRCDNPALETLRPAVHNAVWEESNHAQD